MEHKDEEYKTTSTAPSETLSRIAFKAKEIQQKALWRRTIIALANTESGYKGAKVLLAICLLLCFVAAVTSIVALAVLFNIAHLSFLQWLCIIAVTVLLFFSLTTLYLSICKISNQELQAASELLCHEEKDKNTHSKALKEKEEILEKLTRQKIEIHSTRCSTASTHRTALSSDVQHSETDIN